eukprot:4604003-Lingulodinium_polyedra.AAC.1
MAEPNHNRPGPQPPEKARTSDWPQPPSNATNSLRGTWWHVSARAPAALARAGARITGGGQQ